MAHVFGFMARSPVRRAEEWRQRPTPQDKGDFPSPLPRHSVPRQWPQAHGHPRRAPSRQRGLGVAPRFPAERKPSLAAARRHSQAQTAPHLTSNKRSLWKTPLCLVNYSLISSSVTLLSLFLLFFSLGRPFSSRSGAPAATRRRVKLGVKTEHVEWPRLLNMFNVRC